MRRELGDRHRLADAGHTDEEEPAGGGAERIERIKLGEGAVVGGYDAARRTSLRICGVRMSWTESAISSAISSGNGVSAGRRTTVPVVLLGRGMAHRSRGLGARGKRRAA